MAAARVAIAQINAYVGDIKGNAARVLQAARAAHAEGADVLVTPELVLTGYPPEDLLLRPHFVESQEAALNQLRQDTAGLAGLHVLVGHVLARGGRLYNAATVLCEGRELGVYCKRELPNYSVFDEQRYFAAADQPLVFEVKGVRFGVNICEDIWFGHAPRAAAQAGAQVLLVPNASPYNTGKQDERLSVARRCAQDTGCAVIYANMVGGQDELVFDGASFALDAQGQPAARLPDYAEGVNVVEADAAGAIRPVSRHADVAPYCLEEQVWNALVLAVRDYLGKNGFPGAIIGLSGGIDSAVVLAVAVDALGADNVTAVRMPSRYTADLSNDLAQEQCDALGVRLLALPIEKPFQGFLDALGEAFAGTTPDTTEENLQSRTRGALMMALSNKFGGLLLTTGNKSEYAVGYATIYGDMCGGYAPIKDLYKTEVFAVAKWRNAIAGAPVIPPAVIARPPSAELRENQLDQDSLPPYDVLDAILLRHIDQDQARDEIVRAGFDSATVDRVLRLVRTSEWKRHQSAPGPKVSRRAFGRERRYPISNGYGG